MEPTLNVLHVDDDPEFLTEVRRRLEAIDSRLEVVGERSPDDALSRLREEPVDCLVSDYRMPGMDGLEFLAAVREKRPDVPFVLFTGESSESFAAEAIRAGVTDYLRKGSRSDQYELLANRVRNAAEQYRTERRRKQAYDALEAAGEGIAILDEEGRFDYVNRAFADQHDVDASDLQGDHWKQTCPEPVRECLREECLPAVRDAGSWSGRIRRTDQDGSTVHEELSVRSLEDGSVVCVVRGVTEEVERQRTLESERDQLSALFENVTMPTVYYEYEDGEPLVERANPAFEETFGVEQSSISGRPIDDVLVPPEKETESRDINRRVLEGEVITTEVERLAADGRRTFELVSVPYRPGESGERGFAVYRPPADRERQRHTLQALHEFGTTVQDAETVEAIARQTVDVAADVLDFYLCTVMIREDDKLVPKAASENSPPDGVRVMDLDEGLAGKTYQTRESHVISDTTEDEDSEPAKNTYMSGVSVPVGDHGVFQAVSERPDDFDEDDLEMAELLVSHTTSALDNLERERRLERKNERLDEFASIVSHDLRNPIEVATANLELARTECSTEYHEAIEDALGRMGDIIEDTLTLARQGVAVGETSVVNLRAVSRRSWTRVDSEAGTLEVVDDVDFEADPDRIDHVFENLFSNAIEHGTDDETAGREDDRTVTVRVGVVGTDGFYVEDDGPGVPEDVRDSVFDRGYSTTDSGVGFGLNIVERIVEAHGWSVSVTESAEGGARFEVTGVDVVED